MGYVDGQNVLNWLLHDSNGYIHALLFMRLIDRGPGAYINGMIIAQWRGKGTPWVIHNTDLYGYVQERPLNYTDPHGLSAWKIGPQAELVPGFGLEGGFELYLNVQHPSESGIYADVAKGWGANAGVQLQAVYSPNSDGLGTDFNVCYNDTPGETTGGFNLQHPGEISLGGGLTAGEGVSAGIEHTGKISFHRLFHGVWHGISRGIHKLLSYL